MSKRTRNILIIIGVLLIVFLIVAKKQGWIGQEEGIEVETVEVTEMILEETVIATGKIQPEVEVNISSEVSGEIVELNIEDGDSVQKGDLLLRINPDIYQAAVNRARASLSSSRAGVSTAQAQFKEAESNYNRNKKLAEQNVISQAEFDAIQRAYDVAKLGVESAEFQLQSAQASYNEASDNLKRTTIYAPQSGTVSMLNVELGERVLGTAQMTGTEIARIANLDNLEVLVEVNENDIIRVGKGDTAIIEVDAYLDKEFKGVVTQIANSAQTQGQSVDQVTNFEVKVRMLKSSYADLLEDGQNSPFRPGMTASVEIKTDRRSGILAVPIEAVTVRSDTSKEAKSYQNRRKKEDGEEEKEYEVVFLYDDGKAHLTVVETGIQDDENIEIKSGLEAGQTVITGPYSLVSKKLVNGDEVEIKSGDSDDDEEETNE